MVYVLNQYGEPLMPTNRHGKVRRLLKGNKAKVIKRCPFTIQLLYETTSNTQVINLGVDAGSKHIGLSATTKDKVLYEADVEIRNDIVELISTKRELRRSRRNRKTRYRKPRFDNRVKAKKKGWLAPSVKQKIMSHLQVVENAKKILPITNIIVECASFDIQKINNPDISGVEYQQGNQFGFWNVREYVLWRDNHECQYCHGKSKDPILNVHHIESRKTGGDSPSNLMTLCETCHHNYHQSKIELKVKRNQSLRNTSFMGIMRWAFYNELKARYKNVSLTYGYITKNARITNNLPKEHYVDARCISGNPLAKPLGYYFYQKKVRCHNRQIHKCKIQKGGKRKNNQAAYIVKGFRLFDKVKFNGQECFIFGRRTSGSMDIRLLDGTKISPCARYKKLKLIEPRGRFLTERRQSFSPTTKAVGFHD